jgi:hypothetical protein
MNKPTFAGSALLLSFPIYAKAAPNVTWASGSVKYEASGSLPTVAIEYGGALAEVHQTVLGELYDEGGYVTKLSPLNEVLASPASDGIGYAPSISFDGTDFGGHGNIIQVYQLSTNQGQIAYQFGTQQASKSSVAWTNSPTLFDTGANPQVSAYSPYGEGTPWVVEVLNTGSGIWGLNVGTTVGEPWSEINWVGSGDGSWYGTGYFPSVAIVPYGTSGQYFAIIVWQDSAGTSEIDYETVVLSISNGFVDVYPLSGVATVTTSGEFPTVTLCEETTGDGFGGGTSLLTVVAYQGTGQKLYSEWGTIDQDVGGDYGYVVYNNKPGFSPATQYDTGYHPQLKCVGGSTDGTGTSSGGVEVHQAASGGGLYMHGFTVTY